MRIPYTSSPICVWCNISTLHVGSCNHCCSWDKTSRTERLNSGNQCNRELKMVRKGRHEDGDWLSTCCVTLPPMGRTRTREVCVTQPSNYFFRATATEQLLKPHTKTPVIVLRKRADNVVYTNLTQYPIVERILIPQFYMLSKYPCTIDCDLRRQCQDVNNLKTQETNGRYLFVPRCWTLILNLQFFKPTPRPSCLQQ